MRQTTRGGELWGGVLLILLLCALEASHPFVFRDYTMFRLRTLVLESECVAGCNDGCGMVIHNVSCLCLAAVLWAQFVGSSTFVRSSGLLLIDNSSLTDSLLFSFSLSFSLSLSLSFRPVAHSTHKQ